LGPQNPLESDRERVLSGLLDWLTTALGTAPRDLTLYERALTHGSHGVADYQRLEFLGDRVLGLVIARWLYEAYPNDKEGQLSARFNALVRGETCAQVARALKVQPHLRLGKQARDDGAFESDNVLGDVAESLIGALLIDHGLDAAETFIRTQWIDFMSGQTSAPRHPKSALQEWAAAHNRKPPVYAVTDRSGPGHAPRFTVSVSLGSAGEASAAGSSKQEAETAAAAALLEKLEA
jgi:ribonuclease-3